MSTMVKPVLDGRDHLDITDLREAGPILAALREVNDEPAAAGGFVWFFPLGSSDADPTLAVGVRGEIGALTWYVADRTLVPVGGLNEDDADCYWTWFGHEFPMQPRSEVPIDMAYQALAEWISTHERPTCVDWMTA
jgi:hypothetical protein